jgi:FkbM family methyltransferase
MDAVYTRGIPQRFLDAEMSEPTFLVEPSYLNDLVNRFVRQRRICIQAGGHHGLWPRFLAGLFKTVITFEPIHHSFIAVIGKEETLPPNVFPMRAGLWSTASMAEFKFSNRRKDGAARIVRVGGGTIPVMPLDAIAPAQEVDFLCLDIEGSEVEALKGAEVLLRQQSPVVALEINKIYGTTIEQIMSVLPSGYRPVETYGWDTVFVHE